MKLELDNEDVIELLDIVGSVYDQLLLQKKLQEKKLPFVDRVPNEEIEDMLFKTSTVMVKINRQAHDAGLCSCPDDTEIERQEAIYRKLFDDRIKTEAWWREHIGPHGGFRVASSPSPTSDRSSSQALPTERLAQGTPPESGEVQEKKHRQKP